MKKIMYIVSEEPSKGCMDLLMESSDLYTVFFVFAKNAIRLKSLNKKGEYFILKEDALQKGVSPAFPTITYHDMLKMIFESDTVIAL